MYWPHHPAIHTTTHMFSTKPVSRPHLYGSPYVPPIRTASQPVLPSHLGMFRSPLTRSSPTHRSHSTQQPMSNPEWRSSVKVQVASKRLTIRMNFVLWGSKMLYTCYLLLCGETGSHERRVVTCHIDVITHRRGRYPSHPGVVDLKPSQWGAAISDRRGLPIPCLILAVRSVATRRMSAEPPLTGVPQAKVPGRCYP